MLDVDITEIVRLTLGKRSDQMNIMTPLVLKSVDKTPRRECKIKKGKKRDELREEVDAR